MFVDNKIRDEVTVLLEEVSRKNIMPFYKNLSAEQVYTKSSPTDFVTIADKECEKFLTKKLMQLIIGSKVIGEEASSENGISFSSFKDNIIWTVDPIDGTKNFVNGNEQFCSMVALLQDGKPKASWIYIPILDICYFASIKGVEVAHYGTEYNILDVKDKKTTSTNVNCLKYCASLRYLEPDIKAVIKDKVKHLKNQVFVGSAGIEAIMLAKGQIDFMFYSVTTPWDHAPVDMFCRAVGGKAGQISFHKRASNDIKLEKSTPVLFVRSIADWELVNDFISI